MPRFAAAGAAPAPYAGTPLRPGALARHPGVTKSPPQRGMC